MARSLSLEALLKYSFLLSACRALGRKYKGNCNGDGHSCGLFAYHQLAKETCLMVVASSIKYRDKHICLKRAVLASHLLLTQKAHCEMKDRHHLALNKRKAGDLIARCCNKRQIVANCP
jgi:hypothetical protein